jgi:hypothetical protein
VNKAENQRATDDVKEKAVDAGDVKEDNGQDR